MQLVDLAQRAPAQHTIAAGQETAHLDVEFLDEQAILLGSEFEAVVLFLDADRLLQVAKSRLTRSFTENECATYGIDPCPTLEVMLSR